MLAKYKEHYKHTRSQLICYEQSAAFCNPANIVNTVHINRAGNRHAYTSRSLADLFNQGYRIDCKPYAGFVSNACHQEVDFVFLMKDSEAKKTFSETNLYPTFIESERNSNNILGHVNLIPANKENIKNMDDTERILADGERMYKNGRFSEAEKMFREIIRNNTGCAQAYNNLSCVLWETGKHNEALQALTKSMEIMPDNRDAVWNLCRILNTMGCHEDANQVYDSYFKRHPEDQDLFDALLWWEDKKNNNENIKIPDMSVIIPAFNCERTIIKTLESLKKSLEYSSGIIDMLKYEVIIVDDNSSDNTVSLVNRFIESDPNFSLIGNSENLGAGPSRNKGVKHSKGDIIFFLDGDDLYLEDHIFLCVHFMIHHPEAHYVKTKVRIDEPIHPYWRQEIEYSIPINICVRRWCHDFIGGFPSENAFKIFGGEDNIYRVLLNKYFICAKIERETVRHFRYPGNSLDIQMEKFSKPPTPTASADSLTDAQRAVWPETNHLINTKLMEIEESIKLWHNHLSIKIPSC